MAIKNYVIKNKRKSTCIFVMLMFLVMSVFVVLHTRSTNAGVYVKDDTGKYYLKNEINVLEIVAQQGQQVLGYTVKGQEPITVEKIEAYNGPANLSTEDFTNATGYEVIRNMSTNEYIVKRSYTNTSFNENILGESMGEGEIVVKAVTANELTTKDVLWADLIYINSNDSHENLLYYYDQVMCGGEMGITLGDKGASYNDVYSKIELKNEVAIKAIASAAGVDNAGDFATKQMFIYLASDEYEDNYYDFYVNMLSQAEYESLHGANLDETYTNIENFIIQCNNDIESESYNVLERLSMKTSDYTQAEKNEIRSSLSSGIFGKYYEEFLEEYCIELNKYDKGILRAEVIMMMTSVNGSKNVEALNNLLLYKNLVNNNIANGNINDATLGTDEYGLTVDEYEALVSNFLILDIDDVKSELVDEYIAEFLSVDFEYSETDNEKIKNLISDINGTVINGILEEISACIGDEDKVTLFAENAESKFAALDVACYNPYDCQEYLDNLSTIEDSDNDGKISIEEFETYVNRFINTKKEFTYSADIKWKVADALYTAVGSEEVALMYNADLIGNKQLLGNYAEDLSLADAPLNNKNNMYKMLLVLRQLRYDYYKANIQSKIDSNGFYYKDGYDSATGTFIGEGVDSWNMYTFVEGDVSDLNNRDKYREPNVVGTTYSKDNKEGLAGAYVQNRVYSYMGEQFFGGENFVSINNQEEANFKSKNTAGTNFALTADEVLDNPNTFVEMSKGDVIRYILEVTLYPLDTKIRVLEIQPAAGGTDFDGTDDVDSQGLCSEFTAKIKTCNNNWYLYATESNTTLVADRSKKTTWRFKRNDDGTYCIYYGDTNLAIDIYEGKTNPGTDVTLYSYHGGNNQKWKIIKKGSGYSFISALSDSCALDQDLGNLSNMQIYTTSSNKAQQFTLEDIKVTSASIGKQKLLDYMGMDSSRADLIQVTTMSVKEFNTRNEDLISNYDLIYFGIDSGYQVLKDFSGVKRTKYNDTDMTGLVYTGIGDKYYIEDHLRGTVASDFYRVEEELPKEFTAYVQSVFNDKYFQVSSESEGKELRTSGSSRNLWRFKYNSSTNSYYIYLENSYNTNKKLLLSPKGGATGNATRITLQQYSNSNAKRWIIKQNRSGYKFILEKKQSIAMDKDSGSGDIMQIYGDYDSNADHSARQFRIEIVDVIDSNKAQIGVYKTASNYSTYDYWVKNFTYPLKNNPIDSWNLDFTGNRWFMKSGSYDYAATRLSGNDITVKRMNDLLEYVKAGYPIMLPEEMYYCDTDKYIDYSSSDTSKAAAQKWRYVDVNSKIYNFITTIKSLGYDKNKNQYTGLDENGEKVFDDGYKYANIVINKDEYGKYGRNPENLPTESKFEGGLKYAIKRSARVDFRLVSCPTEYNKTMDPKGLGKIIKTSDAEYKSFKFELELVSTSKTMEWVKENYKFKVCIDRSGTGRFEDKYVAEIEPSNVVFDIPNNKVTLTGNWPGSMEGFIPWRVVAYSKANPNSSYTYSGFSAFQITKRKAVYALWIKTGENLDFKSLVKNYQEQLGNDREYDIYLITVTLDEFIKLWEKESETTKYNKKNSKLYFKTVYDKYGSSSDDIVPKNEKGEVIIDSTKELDILVFGYCDSYVGLDVNSIPAQHNIDYFVNKAKKSILYVHDNNSYLMSLNYYVRESNDNDGNGLVNAHAKVDNNWSWGRYNTSFLRDTIGQDAYGVTYAPSVFDENSNDYDPNIANTRKYINSEVQEDYRGVSEVCTFIYEHANKQNGKDGNDLYSSTIHGTSATTISGWQHTYTVDNMNKGQLTEYPFIIGNEVNVSLTHSQYAMLNLEDEELTVWYTLGNGTSSSDSKYYNYTKGDGANNFFIYSKENVTYTGAGHASGATDLEKKLFFNTVIASIKAGNFDPTIDFSGATVDTSGNYFVEHEGSDDVMITFKATDYDAKKDLAGTFTESKIFVDVNDNGKFDGNDIELYNYENGKNVSRIHSTETDASGNYVIMKDELKGSKIVNAQYHSFILTNETINALNAELSPSNLYNYPITIQVTDAGVDGDEETKTTVFAKIYIKRIEVVEPDIYGLD